MDAKLTKLSHGNGNIYFLFDISGVPEGAMPLIRAYNKQGNALPLRNCRLSAPSAPVLKVLCIMPALSTPQIKLEFTDAGMRVGAQLAKPMTVSLAKLKLNSLVWQKLNPGFANRMEVAAARQLADETRIEPRYYYDTIVAPGRTVRILKGTMHVPGASAPAVTVLDEDGTPNPEASVYIARPSISRIGDVQWASADFTVRFPDHGSYCVCAHGSSIADAAFIQLDSHTQQALLQAEDPGMFKAACPPLYQQCLIRQAAECAHDARVFLAQEQGAAEGEAEKAPAALAAPGEGAASPLFSIVVPLYQTPPDFFRDMVRSVQEQVYPHWELILVNTTPKKGKAAKLLQEQISSLRDSRIKVIDLPENLGIAENTNKGILTATGDYIVLFDHDDVLDTAVLLEYANAIKDGDGADVLYCDEDCLNVDGDYVDPHFKPDFNIDLLRCHNYITHLLCVRADLAKQNLLSKEYDGAQDYALTLRLTELTRKIRHVPKVLYHWRVHGNSTAQSLDNKGYANEAGRKALQDHLDRLGLQATVELTERPCIYHAKYQMDDYPMVSVIVRSIDDADSLRRCVENLIDTTFYANIEVVIVEQGSRDPAVFELYEQLQSDCCNVRVIAAKSDEDSPVQLANLAAAQSRGDYLLFLHGSAEPLCKDWLGSMMCYCQREDVGAVGAKLLNPDDTVLSAGMTIARCQAPAKRGGPVHLYHDQDRNSPGYTFRATLPMDVLAVSGLCFLTKADLFRHLGGFDKSFEDGCFDVDYCLRVRDAGFLTVFDPYALVRINVRRNAGDTGNTVDYGHTRLSANIADEGRLRARWARYYAEGDPYNRMAL